MELLKLRRFFCGSIYVYPHHLVRAISAYPWQIGVKETSKQLMHNIMQYFPTYRSMAFKYLLLFMTVSQQPATPLLLRKK